MLYKALRPVGTALNLILGTQENGVNIGRDDSIHLHSIQKQNEFCIRHLESQTVRE